MHVAKPKNPKKGIIARCKHEHPLRRRYDIPRNLRNETKMQQIATSQCELKLVDDILE